MDSELKIEKLRSKENWHQWRFIIRTLLEEDDDWLDVCEGRLIEPVASTAEPTANAADAAATAADNAALLAKFKKADKAARKLICTTVESKPLQLLLSCTTAREMWVKLNSVYNLRSDESVELVQKQFFDFKWNENDSVSFNMSKIEQISNRLKALNSPVPHSMNLVRIVSVLPKKFNHFHSAWESVDDSKKTLINLNTRLLKEELRLQNQEETKDNSNGEALMAKSSFKRQQGSFDHRISNKSSDKKNSNSTEICSNCKRTGHSKPQSYRCYTCQRVKCKTNMCPKRKNCNIATNFDKEENSNEEDYS